RAAPRAASSSRPAPRRRSRMDFTFTPEQDELIRTLRAFARKELAPRSATWDRTGQFPWDVWRRMGELGLFGLRAPAEYGGQEADLLTAGIAAAEIARGDFSCTYGIQLSALAGELLGREASDEIKPEVAADNRGRDRARARADGAGRGLRCGESRVPRRARRRRLRHYRR